MSCQPLGEAGPLLDPPIQVRAQEMTPDDGGGQQLVAFGALRRLRCAHHQFLLVRVMDMSEWPFVTRPARLSHCPARISGSFQGDCLSSLSSSAVIWHRHLYPSLRDHSKVSFDRLLCVSVAVLEWRLWSARMYRTASSNCQPV